MLTVLACAVVVAAFAVQPVDYTTAAFVVDDGLYYLEVSRNVTAGNGVTYDNRTNTNGFHPLWGAVCVLTAAVTRGDTLSLLRAAFLVQGLFVVIGLLCLYRLAYELEFTPLGTIVAMLILFFAGLALFLSTMESATLMFALLLLTTATLHRDLLCSTKTRNNVVLGVLLAAVFLARLDTIFIVVAFLFAQFVYGLRGGRGLGAAFPAVKTGLVFTLLTAPYLAANRTYFGSIVPVSGIRKTTGSPHLLENLQALWNSAVGAIAGKLGVSAVAVNYGAAIAAVSVVCLALLPSVRPAVKAAVRNGAVTALAIGIVVRAGYLLAFVDEYTSVPRYWVPEYALAALLAGAAVTMLVRAPLLRWAARPWFVCVSAALLFSVGCVYLVKDANAHQRSGRIPYRTAVWARENLPADKLFAMHDSGYLAYFSERDVIPLNGLVTDRETMEELSRCLFKAVIDRFGVDYFVRILDEDTAIPDEILVYQSPTIPHGVYAGKRINIFDYAAFPEQTARFVPVEDKNYGCRSQ